MKIRFSLGISIVLLSFGSFANADEAPDWRGPLPAQNLRPFQSIFLHFRPENPTALPRGGQKYGLQLDIANNLLIPSPGAQGESVEEDFETQNLGLSLRRGLGNGLEIGADIPLSARNGGILDSSIEIYHNLLGLSGDGADNPLGRDALPRGRSILQFIDANGAGVSAGSAFGLGDATLSLKKQLGEGNFASALRLGLKIPTGSASHILGSGGTDFGLSLDARLELRRRIALFGYGAASKFGDADVVPNARNGGLQGGLALEYRGRKASFLAQTDAATRNVRTGNSFADRTPVIVSVGYKRPAGKDKLFWASFSENGDYHNFHAPFFGNIGPDYTLSLGYEWRR